MKRYYLIHLKACMQYPEHVKNLLSVAQVSYQRIDFLELLLQAMATARIQFTRPVDLK